MPPVGSDVHESQLTVATERVLASKNFERTHRLAELLRYLVSQTLSGDLQGLKEPVIGQRIFGRPCDYNAADDNIVRSNIRQLRIKLDQYYGGEGVSDAWRINIPKGSYAVSLVSGGSELAAGPTPPEPVLAPLAGNAIGKPGKPWRLGFLAAALILTAGLAISSLLLKSEPMTLLTSLAPAAGHHVLVIGADANVQLYERITHRRLSLQEYVDKTYLRGDAVNQVVPGLRAIAPQLFGASATEWFLVASMPEFSRILKPGALYVPPPPEVTLNDLRRDNALLISGPLGNPWVQLFDRDLNFQITTDASGQHVFIQNRSPAPKERARYENYTDANHIVTCYARLAYLPGTISTRVILAGGPHGASTRAALLFITRPDLYRSLRTSLLLPPFAPLPWFEAVIEARALGAEPWAFRIIASRPVHLSATISSQ